MSLNDVVVQKHTFLACLYREKHEPITLHHTFKSVISLSCYRYTVGGLETHILQLRPFAIPDI